MDAHLSEYKDNTRKFFGKLIRDVFGFEPRYIVLEKDEVGQKLLEISKKMKETPELLHYTWWWRGGSNCPIESFDVNDGYLYMDGDRIKVKQMLVQISPIPRFDFILLNIEGEEKSQADIYDYEWAKKGYREEDEIDFDKDTFHTFRVLGKVNEKQFYYKFPYNMILTAKFGAPNNNFFSDSKLEIMLNKLMFGVISYEEFIQWYNTPLSLLKKKVDDFYSYLILNPMLGMNHEVGKLIFKNIKGLPKINIEDKVFYRARELKNMSPYSESEMWNPPAGKVPIGEGRYNHFAKSFLYLANNEETVFKEVIPPWHKTCSMARFKVVKCTNILDLRRVVHYNDDSDNLLLSLLHYILVYEGTISKHVENEYIKNEYLLPRFLADCARSNRFNGILFNSTKNPSGENLVLFDPDNLKKIGWAIMEPEPYLYSVN
ncbi:RES family NAD+ phosphorylase [Paenibacillus validus]|uniref:RES domain-containing protein n=1 Tax=Paenibacillus validus TaxID=44253 RepID=A0A7X3CT12_9BACL|nr:RES family NAD+ phosphorylase [Paenibacillus validus]MUG70602.1 RES domain-containing protein [Paenibacillus validus]